MDNLLKDYVSIVSLDMQDSLKYLLSGLIIGIICGSFFLLLNRLICHKWDVKKACIAVLFFCYVDMVIQIAYLSREPGSTDGVALGLWETWGTTLRAQAYVIENVIFFIPFGLLFPLLGKYARWFCIPTALIASVAIEAMQYISKRGYCQLDDVVTNTLGACIGYLIFWMIYAVIAIIEKISRKEDKE